MPVNLTYGTNPGDNSAAQAADELARQNLQRSQLNMQQGSNIAGALNAGIGLAQQQREIDDASKNLALRRQLLTGTGHPQGLSLAQQYAAAHAGNQGQGVPASGLPAGSALASQYFGGAHNSGQAGTNTPASLTEFQPSGKELDNETTNVLDNEIGNIVGAVSHQQLTPQGQVIYNDWATKMRAVQKYRGKIRPDKYNRLASKLISDFRQTRINNFVVRVPTVQEDWINNALPSNDGGFFVRERDSKGNATFKYHEVGPEDPNNQQISPQAKFDQSAVKLQDGGFAIYDMKRGWQIHKGIKDKEDERQPLSVYLGDRENYAKEYKDAKGRLVATGTDDEPTPQAIRAEMDRYLNDQEQHTLGRAHSEAALLNGMQPAGQPQRPQASMQGAVPPAIFGQSAQQAGQQPEQYPEQQPGQSPAIPAAYRQALRQHAYYGEHPGLEDWKPGDGTKGFWNPGQPNTPNPKRLAFLRQANQELGGDAHSQAALSLLTGTWHAYPSSFDLYRNSGSNSDAVDYEAAKQAVLEKIDSMKEKPAAVMALRNKIEEFGKVPMHRYVGERPVQSPVANQPLTPQQTPAGTPTSAGTDTVSQTPATLPPQQPSPRVLQAAMAKLPHLKSKDEYEALKAGQQFVAPDGSVRVKP